MKVSPQRLTVESFQDQVDWIQPLLAAWNSVVNDLVIGLKNGVTVADNLYQEIKELQFVNSATNFPLRFNTKFTKNPQGILVIYCYDNTNEAYSTAAPWLEWKYQTGQLVIDTISGLTASNTYTIRILIIYG